MDRDNPEFLNGLRDILRNLQKEGGRRQSRRGKFKEDCKVSELPEFKGGTDPEDYLDWERKIESMIEFMELDDEKCFKLAILIFSGGASLWYEGFKARRAREGKEKIASW